MERQPSSYSVCEVSICGYMDSSAQFTRFVMFVINVILDFTLSNVMYTTLSREV